MRTLFAILAFIAFEFQAHITPAQGWTATVDLYFGSGSKPLSSLGEVSVYYSGGTAFSSSGSSQITLTLVGQGEPSGIMYISARGFNGYGEEEYVSVEYEPMLEYYCEPQFIDAYGYLNEHVTGSLTVYPRLKIDHVSEQCDRLELISDICAPTYNWEVSENYSGPFRQLKSGPSSIVSIRGSDLSVLGLNPYGLKFFRVTGKTGTTSPVVSAYLFAPPPDAIFTVTQPKCYNSADGSVYIKITSSYPGVINDFVVTVRHPSLPERQQAVTDSDEVIFDGLAAGSYAVYVQNNTQVSSYGECGRSFEVGPLVNPPKVLISSIQVSDYNGHPISCADGADGSIRVTPVGGTGSFSQFEWMPSVSSGNHAMGLSAGVYKTRVKDSNGCPSDWYSRTLHAPENLTVDLLSTGGKGGYDVSCHDKRDGAITPQVSGGVPAYHYEWNTGEESSGLTNLAVGTYSLTVTDKNGCSAASAINLTAPPPLGFDLYELSAVSCPGEKTGALEVGSVTNNIGTVSYAWSTGATEPAITGQGAGEYAVTVFDDQGCSQTKSATLAEPPTWAVDLLATSNYNGVAIRCYDSTDGELRVTVSDERGAARLPDYFIWQKNGETFSEGAFQNVVKNVGAGKYSISIIYNGSCKLADTLTLEAPPQLNPQVAVLSNFHGFPVSCHNASDAILQVSATGGTGGHQYLWDNGGTGDTRAGLRAGTYTVEVRDANGCLAATSQTVTAPEPLQVATDIVSDYNGQVITCAGANDGRLRATARGGVPAYRYHWDHGATTREVSGVGAGVFTVVVTDANGCSASAAQSVVAPEPVVAVISRVSDYHGFGVSCHDEQDGFLEVTAHGGTASYNFSWEGTSHSGQRYQGLPAGNYTAIVTDNNGCRTTATAEVRRPPKLSVTTLNYQNISCNGGADGRIEVIATGGAGGYAYATATDVWQSAGTIQHLAAGRHEVRVRDANGCTGSTVQSLLEPSPISITFSDITSAWCGDARGAVAATVAGGTGTYQYRWTNAGKTVLSDEAWVSELPAGVYTLTVTDANHCHMARSVGISASDGPSVSLRSTVAPSCHNSSDGSAEVEVLEGTGPFTFLWQDGQTQTRASGLASGVHLVEVTDANGCSVVEAATLPSVEPLELVLAESATPTCYGDCNGYIRAEAYGGNNDYTFSWDQAQGGERHNLCAGTYTVNVRDAKGCEAHATYTLNSPPPVAINLLESDAPDCPGSCNGALTIEASGGTGAFDYHWSTASIEPSITGLCAGAYTVQAKDKNQCHAEETFILIDPPKSTVDLGGAATLCAGQALILDAGGSWKSQQWSSNTGFTSTEQQVIISEDGLYWLEALTHGNCVVRDTFLLQTSRELLKANFLMATEAMVMDTVAAIDVSWPLPETTTWILPDGMTRLNTDDDAVFGQFRETGIYEVRLQASLAGCRDHMAKSIRILDVPQAGDEGRLAAPRFLLEFSLYPNPNTGVFEVKVALSEDSPILITVWNMLTATKVGEVADEGADNYLKHFDIRPLSSGNYTLRLDHKRGTSYLRFIVR